MCCRSQYRHNHTGSLVRSPCLPCVQTLAKNGILSAPVLIAPDLEDLGELRTEQPRPQLLGWVDVNDIVRAFIECAPHLLSQRLCIRLPQACSATAERQTDRGCEPSNAKHRDNYRPSRACSGRGQDCGQAQHAADDGGAGGGRGGVCAAQAHHARWCAPRAPRAQPPIAALQRAGSALYNQSRVDCQKAWRCLEGAVSQH